MLEDHSLIILVVQLITSVFLEIQQSQLTITNIEHLEYYMDLSISSINKEEEITTHMIMTFLVLSVRVFRAPTPLCYPVGISALKVGIRSTKVN